jgi:hypothetical protein
MKFLTVLGLPPSTWVLLAAATALAVVCFACFIAGYIAGLHDRHPYHQEDLHAR